MVTAASVTSFAGSYRDRLSWATEHGLSGPWAVVWPLQVDVFIAVGELALFVALADRWPPRSRAAAWTVTLAGLVVSVAGNVGHVTSHSLTSRGTAAVPPLAAAAALAVGLDVLKRVVERHHKATAGATRGPARKATTRATEAARKAIAQGHPAPSARALARAHHIGRDKATEVRTAMLAEADGHTGQPGPLTGN